MFSFIRLVFCCPVGQSSSGWTRTNVVSLWGIYSPLPSLLGIPSYIQGTLRSIALPTKLFSKFEKSDLNRWYIDIIHIFAVCAFLSSGGGIWTHDLWVMNPASCRTALLRDICKGQFLTGYPAREKEVNRHLTRCITRTRIELVFLPWKGNDLDR